MGINIGRDGPGTKEEGPRQPAKVTATPDQREMVLQSAYLNDTEPDAEWQMGQCGGVDRSFSHLASPAFQSSAAIPYDSGWIPLDDNRRVRLEIVPQPDGGRRAAWVRQHLFSSPGVSEESDDGDDAAEPFAGTGLPMRPLHPAGSGALSVLA